MARPLNEIMGELQAHAARRAGPESEADAARIHCAVELLQGVTHGTAAEQATRYRALRARHEELRSAVARAVMAANKPDEREDALRLLASFLEDL